MAETKPLVSIIVAFYNNTKYIEEAIVSAVSQTYKNIEIIVVDDCSPNEEARRVIKSLSEKYQFKLLTNASNEGPAKTFQNAFEASKGEYISILSHDDVYAPKKIEIGVVKALEENLDAVYSNGAVFEFNIEECKPFNSSEVVAAMDEGQSSVAELYSSKDEIGSLLTQGALFSRKVMSELAWVRNRFLLDDWPFSILVWRNYKVSYIDEVVYYYRHHDDNTHRNYWKWFPARVQTISELVGSGNRQDVLSFVMASMADAAKKSGDTDQGFRFALCAAVLAGSEINVVRAKMLALKLGKLCPADVKASVRSNVSSALFVSTYRYRIIRMLLKLIVAFIPSKKARKRFRAKMV